MRSLVCLVVLVASVGLIIAATPATVLQLQSGSAAFDIVSPTNTSAPYFTLNSVAYRVLGSLTCTSGQSPLYANNDWSCGTFLGFSSSASLVGQITGCANGDAIFYDGTNYMCKADLDTIIALNCAPGQIPGKAGGVWFCDSDDDALPSLGCSAGNVLSWNNGWSCSTPSDANTLGTLSCTAGQTVKFDGSVWKCDADLDTLGSLSCGANMIPKFVGSSWVCATDADVASQLSCANGQTIIVHPNGTANCTATPASPSPVSILVDGQVVPGSSGLAFISSYFGGYFARDYSGFPLLLQGGYTVIGAGFSLDKDPRTQSPADTGFYFAMELFDPNTSTVYANITLPTGTTRAFQSVNIPVTEATGLYIGYRYSNLFYTSNLHVTASVALNTQSF